ncbi:DJ-1/PfpI family protein [Candidatus Lokiarchaeum ossiferum]|uniref:DJ-1/PfpI family protein n=1 Tax=Candidatus Lokiarchaeum ossiferum TaxID=2951803 RepID=UPI00352E07D2
MIGFKLKTVMVVLLTVQFLPYSEIHPQFVLGESAKLDQDLEDQLGDVNILMLVHNSVGRNALDVKKVLESWNCTVTTVGVLLTNKKVCDNRGETVYIDTDLKIAEVNSTILATYDCLFIPSGAYWNEVSQTEEITSFIEKAYNEGLIISSMCVGTGILGKAGDIVSGSKFICHPNSGQLLLDSGGIIEKADVLRDGQFLTGGTGGGWRQGGNVKAPYYEFSAALVHNIGILLL